MSTVEMWKARSLIEQLVLLSAGRQVEFRGESWTMKAPLVENEDIHLGRNLDKLQLSSQYASCRLCVVFVVCWVIEVFHHPCSGHPKHCRMTGVSSCTYHQRRPVRWVVMNLGVPAACHEKDVDGSEILREDHLGMYKTLVDNGIHYTYQLVQDLFHQQYYSYLPKDGHWFKSICPEHIPRFDKK